MDLTEARGAHSHRHFWELSRADSVLKEAGDLKGLKCLDFGAGDLYFAEQIFNRSSTKVVAFDPMASYAINSPTLLATNKIDKAEALAPFDRIFLLDVLEHVEKEESLLTDLKKLLKPDGQLLVTVPAFQFLFSEHDTFLKHYRRYDRAHLLAVLSKNGFEIKKSWYFYASLFSARLAQKALSLFAGKRPDNQEGVGNWPYESTHPVTRILRLVLNVDFAVCRIFSGLGIRIPGLSIFAVCKKSSA